MSDGVPPNAPPGDADTDAGPDADGDPGGDEELPDPAAGVVPALRWFRRTGDERVVFVREVLKSVLAVALVGALLFAVSGVWPPMVAVESGSMEPHMYRGDLVFVLEEHRFASGAAYDGTGVVPHVVGENAGYWKFGNYGDVIVFKSPTRRGSPIIHRARFWVEEGENWVTAANDDYLPTESCDALQYCPAPHAGFITKGDNNPYYDQARGLSPPVKPDWIRGRAAVRIPWLGYVRLAVSGAVVALQTVAAASLVGLAGPSLD